MKRVTSQSGFTLLEMMLTGAILAIVIFKGAVVMRLAFDSSSKQTNEVAVEDDARRVLHRIADAIMSSDREGLDPTQLAPGSSSDLQYRINLGIQNGEVIWSDPEMIALEEDDLQVFWSRNPETAEEMRVIWTSLVAPYLEGEIPNGMDDNGNGLIDEKGLSFVVDRNAITIRLTLDREVNGRMVTKSVETTVTCRNLGDE